MKNPLIAAGAEEYGRRRAVPVRPSTDGAGRCRSGAGLSAGSAAYGKKSRPLPSRAGLKACTTSAHGPAEAGHYLGGLPLRTEPAEQRDSAGSASSALIVVVVSLC